MAEPPMNSPDLMDTFTNLLAHLGDYCAKNGYQTNAQDPTGNVNEENPTRIARNAINPDMRLKIVKDIGEFLQGNNTAKFPSMDIYQNHCILKKVSALKVLYDKSNDSDKNNLIDSIKNYSPLVMQGGKRSKKSKKTKRKATKRKATKRK